MNPHDYEVMRGLAALCGDDPAAMQAMMGAMMGQGYGSPALYNQLAGYGQPALYNQLAAMMGTSLVPGDPQAMLGAMMGWNPLASLYHGARSALSTILPGPIGDFFAEHHAKQQALQHTPAAQPHAIAAINPTIPGVAARGGRVQPLGFENGAFVAGGSAVVVVRARPERPFRGGRLVGSLARTGVTATGLVTLVSLQVGTDGQLISSDPISFDSLSPTAFGVQVDLTPAAVGNSIAATVAISALPAMTDRVDFNLTAYGHTMG